MTAIDPTHTPTTDPTDPAAPIPGVPRRPRLLPGLAVLRRTDGETQVGAHPRHAVVISGVPDSVAPLLHALDGRDTAEELLARAGPEGGPVLTEILTGLADIGLLDDANPADRQALAGPARLAADRMALALHAGHPVTSLARLREDSVVVVHGSGRVAVSLATLLAASGVGRVHVAAEGVVQPEDTGSGYLDEDIGRPRAEAAARAVRRVAPEAATARPAPTQPPDLVIIADVTVPDPRLSTSLAAAGTPHLLAHAAEGTGVVGPLVIPGRTACLRCVDLHNTAFDPWWPTLATQLADRLRPADLASTQATAGFAAGQALRFLHGPAAGATALPVWGAAIELDALAGLTRRIELPPHPDCPCGVARHGPPGGPAPPGAPDQPQPAPDRAGEPAEPIR